MKNILRIAIIIVTAAVIAVALPLRMTLYLLGKGVKIIGSMASRIN